MAAVRLGVLGGTFDPVHYGHLVLAEQAREQLGLERVLWVPAGDPWRKAARPVSAAEHRLAMLGAALEGNGAFSIDTTEIEREGPSYSVDTLQALTSRHAGAELVFLVGADALLDLANWHEPRRLLELASLGATARGGARPTDQELDRLLPGLSARVRWFEMPRIDVSATDLRRRSADGRSLSYLVPPVVEAYIAAHGLYRRG